MSKYTTVFFDLDHTLWDYEVNSREALLDLHSHYDLKSKGIENVDDLYFHFKRVNTELWDLYDRNIITSEIIRRERFKQILEAFGAFEQKLCDDLSHDYLNNCPLKCNLIPNALETLDYLSQKYRMTIVTNGFEEIQNIKLTSGKITHYFDHVITSQKAGHRKPAREIFEYALQINGASAAETIMIGDNLITDIAGAKNASIDTVFFNPDGVVHDVEVRYQIKALEELQEIL